MKILNLHFLMAASLLSMTGSNASIGSVCPCDKKCVPGFKTNMRLVPSCEVDSFPQLISDNVLPAPFVPLLGDNAALDGDIILDAITQNEGYWREYEIIDESGNITDTMVGAKGAKTFDTLGLFRLACVDRDQKGFAKLVSNGCFLVAIQKKSGQWEIVGTKDNPAHFESIILSRGALPTDANEGTYAVKANTGCTALDYDGAFDLTPNV